VKFPWVLTFPCFLHQLNTIIGKIAAFPAAKQAISSTTQVITFFISSHYWGGQEDEVAKREGITRSLKTYTESRWYSLIILLIMFQCHQNPLTVTCLRPDAQKKTNGLSPVNRDVVDLVLNRDHWCYVDQIIRICKPIVDAIGNIESRAANLADCMLEGLRCASALGKVQLEEGDDEDFLEHARAIFNQEFDAMNTDIHSLALFLHPLCKKLAIHQTIKKRTLDGLMKTAMKIAMQWEWNEAKVVLLCRNLKDYYYGNSPFIGSHKDALEYWEKNLVVDSTLFPLHSLAIILFRVVPHAADVERLFSDLGGIQGLRRNNLSVENFEALAKMRSHYTSVLREQGLIKPRKHAHMHTQEAPGINIKTINTLQDSEIVEIVPPAPKNNDGASDPSAEINALQDPAEDPESTTEDDVEQAFERLSESENNWQSSVDLSRGGYIEAVTDYDLAELERVDKGITPLSLCEEISIIPTVGSAGKPTWTFDSIRMKL
jgi:protein-tyrosine-phosphatase